MHKKTPIWLYWLIAISLLVVLVVDVITPIGQAEFIFFFIPVVLTIYSSKQKLPFLIAVVSTLASFGGFWLSPRTSFNALYAELNRGYSIVTLWAVAYVVYQTVKARNSADRETWLRDGVAKVLEASSGELSVEQVVNQSLEQIALHLGAHMGVVYVPSSDQSALKLIGGYQFVDHAGALPKSFKIGEGLIGEVARSRKTVTLQNLEQRELRLNSALASKNFSKSFVFPLVTDRELKAVGELLFFEACADEAVHMFLNRVSDPFATVLKSAQYKVRLRELLEQSQQQGEELQAQQEELRVVNEELEQQVSVVKHSQAKLESSQAELEQINQQLEVQASELERQKEALEERNTELYEVQKTIRSKAVDLEQASQYKSEFLANMSHELRTPLNSSLILARLLADNPDGNLTKEQVDFAETIYSAGNDLLLLINDVLDLSKVEAGHLEVRSDHIAVPRIVESVKKLFEPLASKKELSFKVTIDSEVPKEMISDRQRIEQILKNLLSNAFKFTSKGEVGLEISSANEEILFKVKDTGVGIPPEQQEIIFEAFRQADGTTNRKFGGTGLGLSISRELAKLLGGYITVESQASRGSIFTLHLPVAPVKPPQPSQETEGFFSQPRPPVSRAIREEKTIIPDKIIGRPAAFPQFTDDRLAIETPGRLILIVEDDTAFSKSLYSLAREMKFNAIVAHTAEEGVSLAQEYNPSAILLDVHLPDHSGLTVLDTLKNDPKTRHIPIHIISAEDFSKTAFQLGAFGYLVKPVKRDQLIGAFSKIEEKLNQKLKRVLVVEDDPNQQKALVALVSDEEVAVTAVTSASEALKKLADETFDCMILDLSLPDLGGFELLEQLADADSKYSYPPVIVYTGRDVTAAEEQRLRRFSDSIIIKGARSPERLLNEVTLFLHRVETALPPDRQQILKDLRSRDKTLEGRTVLVVDDDVRNVFAMTGLLEPKGAKVEIARNGVEAVEKATTNSAIDLVLMDIMMPEMDGFEAMRKIREVKKLEKLPIIAITAKAMKDDQQECLRAGANDYLAKPVDTDRLLSLIRIWMPRKGI